MNQMRIILGLLLFVLPACTTINRGLSSEPLPTMSWEYPDGIRIGKLFKTVNEKSIYAATLSPEQQTEYAQVNPGKLLLGPQYCKDGSKEQPSKFKETDTTYSNLLNIRNPFSDLEDQFNPEVQKIVERENAYTFSNLVCDQSYNDTLLGLLAEARKKKPVLNSQNKVIGFQSYPDITYKNFYFNRIPGAADDIESTQITTSPIDSEVLKTPSEKESLDWLSQKKIIYIPKTKIIFSYSYIAPSLISVKIQHLSDKLNLNSVSETRDSLKKLTLRPLSTKEVITKIKAFAVSENSVALGVISSEKSYLLLYYLENGIFKSQNILTFSKQQTILQVYMTKKEDIAMTVVDQGSSTYYLLQKDKVKYRQLFENTLLTIYNSNGLLLRENGDHGINDYFIISEDPFLKQKKMTLANTDDLKIQTLTYKTSDQLTLRSRVFQQKNVTPQFILIKFYGGFLLPSDPTLDMTETYLTSVGGIVVKAQIRGDDSSGFDAWLKSQKKGRLSSVKDLAQITQDIQKRYPHLKEKIFLEGWSNGGLLALNAGLTDPDLYAGIIAGSPNADIIESCRLNGSDWSVEYGNGENLNILQETSPYHRALKEKKNLPPILIRTAYGDPAVEPSNSFKMLAALRNYQQGGPFYLITMPYWGGHSPEKAQQKIEEYSYIYKFIFQTLKNQQEKKSSP